MPKIKYKKRADGRYQAQVMIGYNENTGKPIRKTLYAKTGQELDNKVAGLKIEVNTGTYIADEITVGEWMEKWQQVYCHNKSYSTRINYENIIKNHIIPEIGNIKLKELKKIDLQKIINSKLDDAYTETARKIKSLLKSALRDAIADGYAARNVAEGVIVPIFQNNNKRALNDYEKHIVDITDLDDLERMFVELLRYTGVRRGEALALMRSDIDFKNGVITIDKTVIFKSNAAEIQNHPKTASGVRKIPLLESLKDKLKAHLKKCDSLYVFSEGGKPLTKSRTEGMCRSISVKINATALGTDKIRPMEKITPHVFRHTFATDLYNAGIDAKTAQSILGHKDISTTLQIYTHLTQDNVQNVDKLNSFYCSQKVVETDAIQ